MNLHSVSRNNILALYLVCLVFGNANAMIITVTFTETDGKFEANKPINFLHLKPLGEGSGGSIHLVEIGTDSVQYALKKAKKGEELMLDNEWQAAKRIPNNVNGRARILKIFAIGTASGDILEGDVLLMEYVNYSNLFEIGFEDSNTRLETILSVALLLVDCFEILSASEIYHMDIKPDNILYNPVANELVLLDLGFACFKGSQVWREDSKQMYGTIPYMCPCLTLQEPNSKCDIRSMMFMLAVPKFHGNLPWMDFCNKFSFEGKANLFPNIVTSKQDFENNLETCETLGPVLKTAFRSLRDEVLKNKTGAVNYSTIRTIFATGLANLQANQLKSAKNEKNKEKNKDKNTAEKNKKTERKHDTDLFQNSSGSKKTGEKKSFSNLSGVKLRVPSFLKKFFRGNWQKSKVTV